MEKPGIPIRPDRAAPLRLLALKASRGHRNTPELTVRTGPRHYTCARETEVASRKERTHYKKNILESKRAACLRASEAVVISSIKQFGA